MPAGEVNVSGHTEAAREVARLRGAAVVLTTYDVLQREVHFSPNKDRLASLRTEKRYVVPESPLLTLRSAPKQIFLLPIIQAAGNLHIPSAFPFKQVLHRDTAEQPAPHAQLPHTQ